MAYVEPTAAGIIARYPAYTGQEVRLNLAILDAAYYIEQESWDEADYTLAKTYAALHLLTLWDMSDTGDGGGSATGEISSESIGAISISYASGSAQGSYNSELLRTNFGRMLYEMMRANFPAVAII